MPLFELGAFHFPAHDARKVMVQYVPDRIFCLDQLHAAIIPLFGEKNNGIF
jgi:hypothetical protein